MAELLQTIVGSNPAKDALGMEGCSHAKIDFNSLTKIPRYLYACILKGGSHCTFLYSLKMAVSQIDLVEGHFGPQRWSESKKLGFYKW